MLVVIFHANIELFSFFFYFFFFFYCVGLLKYKKLLSTQESPEMTLESLHSFFFLKEFFCWAQKQKVNPEHIYIYIFLICASESAAETYLCLQLVVVMIS